MVYEQLHTFTKYIQKVIGRSREILSIAHSFSENLFVPGTCVKKEKKSPLLGLLKNLNVLKHCTVEEGFPQTNFRIYR